MHKSKILHQEQGVTPLTISCVNQWGFHEKYGVKYMAPLKFDYSFIEHLADTSINWYGDYNNWEALGELTLNKVKQDPNFTDKVLAEEFEVGSKLIKLADEIAVSDLSTWDKEKVAENLGALLQLGKDLCGVGLIAVTSDLRHFKLSNTLKSIINNKLKEFNLGLNINEVFSTLITPTQTIYARDLRLDLLRLAKEFSQKKEMHISDADSKIRAIATKYVWYDFGYLGPSHEVKYYVQEIEDILSFVDDIDKRLSETETELEILAEKQKELEKKLVFSQEEANLFKAARDFMYNKQYRTETEFKLFYVVDLLLERACELVSVRKIDLHYCVISEVLQIIRGEMDIKELPIAGRKKHCICIEEPGKGFYIISGSQADKYIRHNVEAEEYDVDVTTIHGMVAYPGEVEGEVKIVKGAKDIDKLKTGDILVAVQTTPDVLPAMKKAAGFVTDIGGITCHAAIVAREMKKPCIVGTKIASKVFKDGDRIKVDGNNGDVLKLA